MEINEFQKDQLREVMSIGVGNATTALSKMLGKPVMMGIPEVVTERIELVNRNLGVTDEITTAILLSVTGDAPGIALITFPASTALAFVGMLTNNHKKDIKIIDEVDRSALKEAGNIFTGALTAALSKLLGLNMLQSIPDVASDMFSALISSVVAEIGSTSETVLILKTTFLLKEPILEGHIYLFFTPEASRKILNSMAKFNG